MRLIGRLGKVLPLRGVGSLRLASVSLTVVAAALFVFGVGVSNAFSLSSIASSDPVSVRPECQAGETVEVVWDDNHLDARKADPVSSVTPVSLVCGAYEVVLVSEDGSHRSGWQSFQTEESWYVELVDESGDVVEVSSPIDDLPDAETKLEQNVGVIFAPGEVVGVQARHVHQGSNPNSVNAVKAIFTPLSTPREVCTEEIVEGGFDGVDLRGDIGPVETDPLPVSLTCDRYEVELITIDEKHAAGHQTGQTGEVWLLEFLDATGSVTASSSVSDDLPDDQLRNVTTVGVVDVGSEVVAVRARHVGPDGKTNSIESVRFRLIPVDVEPVGPMCLGELVTISGTDEDDVLVGTDGVDVIDSGAGHDVVDGLAGDDLICAGDGEDVVNAGDGNDQVQGDAGDDVIEGGIGDDVLVGGTGDDVLLGGEGADNLVGDAGDDVLEGGAGDDTVDASSADGFEVDVVDGGDGDDVCEVDPADVEENC